MQYSPHIFKSNLIAGRWIAVGGCRSLKSDTPHNSLFLTSSIFLVSTPAPSVLLFDISFFFAGVYTFGLFTVDIFVNAGQVVTGNLAPYFLTVCKPNYTALGCQQALRYISHQEACTGNQDDILRARKTFPSKEAALSVYAALYLAVSHIILHLLLIFFIQWVKLDLNIIATDRYSKRHWSIPLNCLLDKKIYKKDWMSKLDDTWGFLTVGAECQIMTWELKIVDAVLVTHEVRPSSIFHSQLFLPVCEWYIDLNCIQPELLLHTKCCSISLKSAGSAVDLQLQIQICSRTMEVESQDISPRFLFSYHYFQHQLNV